MHWKADIMGFFTGFLQNFISRPLSEEDSTIREGVHKTIIKYADALKTLEKYDKGEIKHNDSTRHSSLRDYLQQIQRESREIPRNNGRTITSL